MRELVAGGVYHAVARGNRGARIFRDDADYAEYLKLLAGVVKRFRWAVLASMASTADTSMTATTYSGTCSRAATRRLANLQMSNCCTSSVTSG